MKKDIEIGFKVSKEGTGAEETKKAIDDVTKAVEKQKEAVQENTNAVNPMSAGWDEHAKEQEEAKKKIEETTKAVEKQKEVIEENTKATQEVDEATEESAVSLEEHSSEVADNLKVVEDSTDADIKKKGALGQVYNAVKIAGAGFVLAKVGMVLYKTAVEAVTRAIGFKKIALVEEAEAQSENSRKLAEAAEANRLFRNELIEVLNQYKQSIKESSDATRDEIDEINANTDALKANISARTQILDQELALEIAKVEAGGGTEVEKLQSIANLRKKFFDDKTNLEKESLNASLEAEASKELAARNRLNTIIYEERKASDLIAEADNLRLTARVNAERANNLELTRKEIVTDLDNNIFDAEKFAEDADDFEKPEDYIKYIQSLIDDETILSLSDKDKKSAQAQVDLFNSSIQTEDTLKDQSDKDIKTAENLETKFKEREQATRSEKDALKKELQDSAIKQRNIEREIELAEKLAALKKETTEVTTGAQIKEAKKGEDAKTDAKRLKALALAKKEEAAARGDAESQGKGIAGSSPAFKGILVDGRVSDNERGEYEKLIASLKKNEARSNDALRAMVTSFENQARIAEEMARKVKALDTVRKTTR